MLYKYIDISHDAFLDAIKYIKDIILMTFNGLNINFIVVSNVTFIKWYSD